MKAGNQTSELYVTLVSSLVGAATLFGIVASDQSLHLINAGVTIISAVISIAPAVAYIWGRTWLKGKVVSAGPTLTVNGTTTTSVPTTTGRAAATSAAGEQPVLAGASDAGSQ